MKKVCVLVMVMCLGLAASVWAADIPGQKLTDAEASSIRGTAFTLPVGCFVIVNGTSQFVNATPTLTGWSVNTGTLSFGTVTVGASATFTR